MENTKEIVAKFKKRVNAEVKKQERIDRVKERKFLRKELLEKYMAKMLYGWNNEKFENEYLKKLEKNWEKWKGKDKMI